MNRQIFRQADFIALAVHNVVEALRDAAIIVTIILALFLLNCYGHDDWSRWPRCRCRSPPGSSPSTCWARRSTS